MDEIDRHIINTLQAGFPICDAPYKQVAVQLGLTEQALIERLQALLDDGVLTRFGPLYHAELMGGALTLAAVKVPPERFDEVTGIINAFPEVAHNYARNHALNMWFVIATETPEQIQQTLTAIEQQTGLTVYNMPKINEYFVGLKLESLMITLDETDLSIMRATQVGLPLTPQPYQHIAKQLGLTAKEVMECLAAMQENGIIRRIGAIPNHYKLGYRYNGMTVWNVPDEIIDELGQKVGQLAFVSHCYHRPRHLLEWPYNLFAMVHGKNQEDVDNQIQQIADLLGDSNQGSDVLYSTKILKKTGFRSRNEQ